MRKYYILDDRQTDNKQTDRQTDREVGGEAEADW